MGGGRGLQFAGSVLGDIWWGTSWQQCRDNVDRDPYHLWSLINQSICPGVPRLPRTGYGTELPRRPHGPPGGPRSWSGAESKMPSIPRLLPSNPAPPDGPAL